MVSQNNVAQENNENIEVDGIEVYDIVENMVIDTTEGEFKGTFYLTASNEAYIADSNGIIYHIDIEALDYTVQPMHGIVLNHRMTEMYPSFGVVELQAN